MKIKNHHDYFHVTFNNTLATSHHEQKGSESAMMGQILYFSLCWPFSLLKILNSVVAESKAANFIYGCWNLNSI